MAIKFTTTILKFGEQGEKTGWTYILIPFDLAEQLMPGNKKSFRVKGKLDELAIAQVALLPLGGGDFILPLNAQMRRGIGKRMRASVKVELMVDDNPILPSEELMECLADEPNALAFYHQLSKAEKNYYTKWIDSAKTIPTKAKRIAQAINGFNRGLTFGPMIRDLKEQRG